MRITWRRQGQALVILCIILGMVLAVLATALINLGQPAARSARSARSSSWEIVPFPTTDPGSPILAEAVRRLTVIDTGLRTAARANPGNSARRRWLTSDTEFAQWRSAAGNGLDPAVFTSPWGTPIEYIFTDHHHSYTLNAYDTAGSLAVSFLGGASHRVGPIVYQAPANLLTPLGVATDNFIWNRDAWASPVCNLVADAMRESERTDVALLNFLAVRAHLPKGTITREHLAYVLPFPNRTAVVMMTGEQLVRELEVAMTAGKPFTVSGLRLTGHGYRLANGSLLADGDTYAVALPDYIATGGRYGDAATFTAYPRREGTAALLVEVTADYIRRHSPIAPDPAARLKVGLTTVAGGGIVGNARMNSAEVLR